MAQNKYQVRCIVICYKYPPQADTASQRPFGWTKYMSEFGIYPIVITKSFNRNQKKFCDIEKFDTHEVHRLNVSEELFYKFKNKKGVLKRIFRKVTMYLYPHFHTSYLFGPFKKMRDYMIDFLLGMDDVLPNIILSTARPYGLFRVAQDVSLATGIPWIADYRDDWTTTELHVSDTVRSIYNGKDYKLEKKWLSSAKGITTVSHYYLEKILFLAPLGIKSAVVQNGFFEDQYLWKLDHNDSLNDTLSFIYVGSLYPTQDIFVVLKGIAVAINQMCLDEFVHIDFIGTRISEDLRREWTKSLECSNLKIRILPRMAKEVLLDVQRKYHYSLIVPHTGLKGVPSSKIYEFVGSQIAVLAHPGDKDVIDHILIDTGLGLISYDSTSLIVNIKKIIIAYKNGETLVNPKVERIKSYSRRKSTEDVSNLIKEIVNAE